MFGFYVALAVFLVVAILILIFRISRLIGVVKGTGEKTTMGSNNLNAIMMIVFMVGFFGLAIIGSDGKIGNNWKRWCCRARHFTNLRRCTTS